jgi:ribonuclease J
VSRVINNLSRVGVTVHHGRNTHVHVSGHAAAEELKVLYNIVKPEAVVPVHGEHRHLLANAEIARSVGVPEVAVCEDGDVVVLEDGRMRVDQGAISSGYIYVDGLEVGEDEGVLRDRRHLADDGVILITIGIDVRNGDIVFGPDVEQGIETLERPIDPDALRSRIRNSARKAVQSHIKRRPVVFPVVIQV